MQITNAIIEVAQKPVFAGVGGGTTAGPSVNKIALDAELHGASAVDVYKRQLHNFVFSFSLYSSSS